MLSTRQQPVEPLPFPALMFLERGYLSLYLLHTSLVQFGSEMKMKFGRGGIVVSVFVLSACAGSALPPANGMKTVFDPTTQAIQIIVSNAQAPHDAALVSDDGTHYPVTLTLVSTPHIK